MIQSTTLRLFTASLAAATAFFVIPALILTVNWFDMAYVHADGTPDNAPIRGLGILILSTPAIFVLHRVATFLGALSLRSIGQLNPRTLLVVVAITSFSAGFLMTFGMPIRFADTLLYFSVIASLTICVTGFSAWTWWKVATWRGRTVKRAR